MANVEESSQILQIKLHYCKAASDALLLQLVEDVADIDLVQNPWLAWLD